MPGVLKYPEHIFQADTSRGSGEYKSSDSEAGHHQAPPKHSPVYHRRPLPSTKFPLPARQRNQLRFSISDGNNQLIYPSNPYSLHTRAPFFNPKPELLNQPLYEIVPHLDFKRAKNEGITPNKDIINNNDSNIKTKIVNDAIEDSKSNKDNLKHIRDANIVTSQHSAISIPNSQSNNKEDKPIFDITKVRLVYKQPKSLQGNYFPNGLTELKTSNKNQIKKGENNITNKQMTLKISSKTKVKTDNALDENEELSTADKKDFKNDQTRTTEELKDVNLQDKTLFESSASSESSKTQFAGERKEVIKLFHGHDPSDEVHLEEKPLNTDVKQKDDFSDSKGKRKTTLREDQLHHHQVDHRHRPPLHNSYHQKNPSRQHQEELQGSPIDQLQQGKEPHVYTQSNLPHRDNRPHPIYHHRDEIVIHPNHFKTHPGRHNYPKHPSGPHHKENHGNPLWTIRTDAQVPAVDENLFNQSLIRENVDLSPKPAVSSSIFNLASFFGGGTEESETEDAAGDVTKEETDPLGEIPESNTSTFLFQPIQQLMDYFYGESEGSEEETPVNDEIDGIEKKDDVDSLDDQILNTIDTLTSPKEPKVVKSIKNMTNTIINIIRKDYFENEFKVENYIAESTDEEYDDRIENDLWNTSGYILLLCID